MPNRNPSAADGGNERNNSSDIFTLDVILQCLVHPWRRHILYVLQDEPIATESDLVNHLAVIEHEQSVDELSTEDQQQIHIQLRQRHLPKLQDAQVIEYDYRSKTVRYTDPPRLLDLALQFTERIDASDA